MSPSVTLFDRNLCLICKYFLSKNVHCDSLILMKLGLSKCIYLSAANFKSCKVQFLSGMRFIGSYV